MVAPSIDELDGARCACPPTRHAYLVELVCSLCARPVASVRVGTPHPRVLLPRPLRCGTCGGVAVQGEVTRVRLPEPIPARVVGAHPRGSKGLRHDAHPEQPPLSAPAPRPAAAGA